MFSDFKGRGFELEDSQLEQADRLERLILIMSLAMYGGVGVGRDDAVNHPTPLEKKSSMAALIRSTGGWQGFRKGLETSLPARQGFCESLETSLPAW